VYLSNIGWMGHNEPQGTFQPEAINNRHGQTSLQKVGFAASPDIGRNDTSHQTVGFQVLVASAFVVESHVGIQR
jgi:hypothetical protein